MPDGMVEKRAEATVVDVETEVEVNEQIGTVEDYKRPAGENFKRTKVNPEPILFALNKKRKKVESTAIEEETKPTESKDLLSAIHSFEF